MQDDFMRIFNSPMSASQFWIVGGILAIVIGLNVWLWWQDRRLTKVEKRERDEKADREMWIW